MVRLLIPMREKETKSDVRVKFKMLETDSHQTMILIW